LENKGKKGKERGKEKNLRAARRAYVSGMTDIHGGSEEPPYRALTIERKGNAPKKRAKKGETKMAPYTGRVKTLKMKANWQFGCVGENQQ